MSESTASTQPSSNLQQLQDEVDQILPGMRNVLENIHNRYGSLDELDTRADALQQGATQFEMVGKKAKKKKQKKKKKTEKGTKKKGLFRRKKGRPKILKKSYWRKKLGLD